VRRLASAFVVAIIAGCVVAPAPPSASPTASAVSAVVATPATGRGTWIAETGIYGTYNHFGNPPNGASFICGVGYNLSYDGGAPLITVDVSVLFPDVFAAHVTPATVYLATGWQHPTTEINSPQVRDAAWLSRIGGAMGAVCQNGPGDMDSIPGSILKVSWTTAEGSYDQEFSVDTIRGEMTELGMPDGRIRVCWAEPSRC
jgi:hypothetical protein